jgi:UDP-N-acetylmuramoyl-L-alanyl-D-glutamate--2,6-diaminopimelate ligase
LMQALLHTPEQAATWLRERVVGQLQTDHRKLHVGDGFIALPGHSVDARQFVPQALHDGAAACLVDAQDAAPSNLNDARIALYVGLKNASAKIAAAFYAHPSRSVQVLAITGTNGKTSSAWWLSQALNAMGAKPVCALIGTLGIGMATADAASLHGLTPSGLTTPDAVLLQHSLRNFADQGLDYCALEASSIGIEAGRLDGTRIRLAVFTNFTQDHLDYHGSMQAYWAAKRRLFAWPGLQAAVLNVDDDHGAVLAAQLAAQAPEIDLWTVSTQLPARLQALALDHGAQGLQFTVVEGAQRCQLSTRIIGGYNVSNLLGVIASLRALGIDLSTAVQACSKLTAVPGRLQCLGGQDAPLAVVDYAHTPDALQKTLEALRPVAQQRGGALWCVFGCGGDRDSAKRPLMGAIAASKADHIVLTSDNPRSENPGSIISHILAGMGGQPHIQVQADRAQAIAQSLTQAGARDVVLIAGKGHEAAQEVAGQKFIFSDADHAGIALALRAQRMAA